MDTQILKHLKIEFRSVNAGWIDFTLILGNNSYNTRFSHCFDPIPDLKSWLEAISFGVEQCSFSFDCEGWGVKINLERASKDNNILSVIEQPSRFILADETEHIEIKLIGNIDRHQLVKAFYLGLLNFRNSSQFNKNEWEIVYQWERLSEMLKVDYDTLINYLVELDGKELKEILFKSYPTYTVEFPTAKDKREEIGLFYDMSVGVATPSEQIIMKIPDEWNIPMDYDFWSAEKKRKFIENCLNERASGFKGMKIEDFRSRIIETYLDKAHG